MYCLNYFRVVFIAMGMLFSLSGCGGPANQPLPAEEPSVVAKRFYDFISDAGVQGGTLPLKEAYKMVSTRNQMAEARFVDIAKKYPPGFRVDVVGVTIEQETKRATVQIEYKMASQFGGTYTVSDLLFLVVDAETNTWKVDFTGESDAQDVDTLKKQAL